LQKVFKCLIFTSLNALSGVREGSVFTEAFILSVS